MTDLVPFIEPSAELDVPAECDAAEVWAATCDSVPELRDVTAQLDAVAAYLASTATDGRNRVAAAKVRLQARIGVLIGPAEPGGGNHGNQHTARPSSANQQVARPSSAPDGLSRDDRSDFRRMAAHPDAIDTVAAESSDADPVSRRKVITRIREQPSKADIEVARRSGLSPARVAELRRENEHQEPAGPVPGPPRAAVRASANGGRQLALPGSEAWATVLALPIDALRELGRAELTAMARRINEALRGAR